MSELEQEIKKYKLVVRAGLGGEDSDVYRWIDSPVPSWAKTVDDPKYSNLVKSALDAAAEIVRYSGKDITLTLLVEEK